jgi:hypothetical protein
MKKFALIAAALFAVATVASAQMSMSQDKSKRPSPPASAECKFSDGKTIKMDYSSPRTKGRKIFGEASDKALVPYGQVWRTGANDATTLVADAWWLVISKKTGEWGTDYPGENEDLVRVPMSVSKTPAPVENFTITFDQGGSKCTLRMEWENTRASVEITK